MRNILRRVGVSGSSMMALVLVLLVTACASEALGGAALTVYLRGADNGGVLVTRSAAVPEGMPALDFLVQQAALAESDGRGSALLPDGVSLVGYELAGGQVTVALDGGYDALSAARRSVIDAGLTLMLTQLDGVDAVSINGGAALCGEAVLLAAPMIQPLERAVKLYFSDGQYLVAEQRMVVVQENEHLARYVTESLLNGTQRNGLVTLIPAKTQLLSVLVDRGVCFVNFSAGLVNGAPLDKETQRLVIASIVASLTDLSDVDKVQILVEGTVLQQYGEVDLAEEIRDILH